MGRVRTGTIKRASRNIIEKYYSKLSLDFDSNKKVIEEVADLPSKSVRNKIAGFITHLMKRLERGTVKGISLKLQEEERERRMDFIPERSVLDVDVVEIDNDTKNMLMSLDFASIPGVKVESRGNRHNKGRGRGPRKAARQ